MDNANLDVKSGRGQSSVFRHKLLVTRENPSPHKIYMYLILCCFLGIGNKYPFGPESGIKTAFEASPNCVSQQRVAQNESSNLQANSIIIYLKA